MNNQVEEPSQDILSNLHIYLAIAEEANAEAQELWRKGRKPRQHGCGGFILIFDPTQRCFKQSLIAITFSAIYLEALLYLTGTKTCGESIWRKYWDRKTYEEKLAKLGITDPEVIESAERFRNARKDLVHEKAIFVESQNADATPPKPALDEAVFAISFIRQITQLLGVS